MKIGNSPERKQECGPEVNLELHPDSGNGRERANVDTPVENVVQTLDSHLGVDYDTLTALERLDDGPRPCVLLGDQGTDVGLDTTGSETENDHADDETGESGAGIEGRWHGGGEEDNESDDVDAGEDTDGIITPDLGDLVSRVGKLNSKGTYPSISNNGSKDWGDVAPKLEEVLQ